jgi:hypothetical protein
LVAECASWDLIIDRCLSDRVVGVAIRLGARGDESSKRKLHVLWLSEI